jgi:cell division protein FtsL
MSVPAPSPEEPLRELEIRAEPASRAEPSEPVAPSARQPAARPKTATPPQRRARRGSTPAFWFLSAAVVSVLVWAIVALGAMVVNTTYRMTDTQRRVVALEERHTRLTLEVATLSSPLRVAEWADMVGLEAPAPGDSVILRVPGETEDRRPGGGGSA